MMQNETIPSVLHFPALGTSNFYSTKGGNK